jgi:hypothetical protein
MNSTLLNTLNQSALMILRPLARIMIRNGISCGNFEALVRKAYVDEAFDMGQSSSLSGKTTISSVAAQTGLSRKEVKRLRELDALNPNEMDQRYNRATRVISGWINHPDFIDANGTPLELTLNHAYPSFTDLVKQFSGDVPVKAMLDVLKNAQCIELQDDKIKLINHAYLPGNDSSQVALILGVDTAEMIETISRNMISSEDQKHFQRKVSTHQLHKDALPEFKALCSQRSQALLEELDSWLSEHETRQTDSARYVSLGIYFYQPEFKTTPTQGDSHDTPH